MCIEPRSLIVEINQIEASCNVPEVKDVSVNVLNFDQAAWLEGTTNTLSTINETLSTLPEGSYVLALVGSLSSVIAAFIFNLLYWWVVDKKKRLQSALNKYLEALTSFEKTATDYWLHPYDKRHRRINRIQEIRIVYDARMLEECGANVADCIPWNFFPYPSNKKSKQIRNDLHAFKIQIYEIATSGDFESSTRMDDLKKVRKIVRQCTSTKILISGLQP